MCHTFCKDVGASVGEQTPFDWFGAGRGIDLASHDARHAQGSAGAVAQIHALCPQLLAYRARFDSMPGRHGKFDLSHRSSGRGVIPQLAAIGQTAVVGCTD
jgi:hypothetical protein